MNKKETFGELLHGCLTVMSILIFSCSAHAMEFVKNNSFETGTATSADVFGLAGVSDWTDTSDLTFLIFPGGATLPFAPSNAASLYPGLLCPPNALPLPTVGPAPAGCFPTTSPSGGKFVAADGGASLRTLWQTINGLIVGQSYNVSFYQAAGQQKNFPNNTEEQWIVSLGGALGPGNVILPDGTSLFSPSIVIGGQSQHSTLMNTPNGDFVNWQLQTMTFQATGGVGAKPGDVTNELLGFLSIGSPSGVPPFVLLDGVSLTAVPEPGTIVLVGIGLVGFLIGRRQLKRRT